MKFIAEFKKEDKKNVGKGLAYLGGAGIAGQQAVRSGVPRLLGVRLESHSTSRKNAKEILKSGYLDPNKGGLASAKLGQAAYRNITGNGQTKNKPNIKSFLKNK